MAKTYTCPSCGAGLDYDGDDDPVVRCSYCGSTVIVPDELLPDRPAPAPVQWSTGGGLTIDLRNLPTMAAKLKAVKQLVVDGQVPEAAQLYQQTLGTSQEESAAAVQQLAAGQSVVISSSSVSTSVPVVSGTRVVTGEEATQLLREQLGMASQQGRRLSRVITNIILAAVVLFVIVFAVVFVVFMLSL